MKRLWEIWQNYWFRSAHYANLAILRLVAVPLQIWLITTWRQTIHEVLVLVTLPGALYQPLPLLRLLTLPFGGAYQPTTEFAQVLATVTIIAGVLAFVGLATNASLLLFALGNLVIVGINYSFAEFHHADALMLLTLILLAVSPSGRVLSLDWLIRGRRSGPVRKEDWWASVLQAKSHFAYWPLLLIQWMYALVYLSSAVAKMHKAGLDWMNGWTLQFHLNDAGVRPVNPLGLWLGRQHELAVVVSWITFLFEATFWLVLFFPRLAWLFVPVGIGMHVGIFLTMGPDFFEFIALYIVFVPWAKVFQFVRSRFAREEFAEPDYLASRLPERSPE
jgi:hypothetical protein